jgi:hypothetical protein
MAMQASYPLRVEADLEPGLSRWLWLVKWFLAIPHFVVLGVLWVAFGVLTVVAFFAVLFTGRYPRPIFEFNVGVLRWTWRVSDYAFGVLGTDRYPPFALADVADYPAHLEVAYPDRLSRGLVLVKWFLAIPQLVIVGILAGGGSWVAWNVGQGNWALGGNLIGVLVVIAAVILAVTGTYPRPMFDLILGLNRWVLRVAAYVSLMTDQYPPLRLDMGGSEPGGTLTIPRPPGRGPAGTPPLPSRPDADRATSGWTGGRITAVVVGSLLALTSLGLLGGGGFLLWAVGTQRDAQGFYTTHLQRFTTDTYALTTSVDVTREWPAGWLALRGAGWFFGPGTAGTVRIRITAVDPSRPVFLGVAQTSEVAGYLDGAERARITNLTHPVYRNLSGGAPGAAPASRSFWVGSSTGPGTRTVTWHVGEGSWTIVAMNADGSQAVDVRADAGTRIPALPWIATGLLIGGVLFLVGAAFLIAVPIRRAGRQTRG